MSEEIAWRLFQKTGKIEYYLAYKNLVNSRKEKKWKCGDYWSRRYSN